MICSTILFWEMWVKSVYGKKTHSNCKISLPVSSILCTSEAATVFGIEAPPPAELTGWRKHLNSYTLQGRRNVSNTLKVNIGRALITGGALIHMTVTLLSYSVCCRSGCCLLDPPAEKEAGVQLRGLSSCWQYTREIAC